MKIAAELLSTRQDGHDYESHSLYVECHCRVLVWHTVALFEMKFGEITSVFVWLYFFSRGLYFLPYFEFSLFNPETHVP